MNIKNNQQDNTRTFPFTLKEKMYRLTIAFLAPTPHHSIVQQSHHN